jgi:hypothetical protein
MINKHENISVGVSWNDFSIPDWKLSGKSNTSATVGSKICDKYIGRTLGVAQYIHSYWDRRAAVCYWVRLRKSDRQRARDLRRDAQVLPQ